jgi:hypothetical protein
MILNRLGAPTEGGATAPNFSNIFTLREQKIAMLHRKS